MADGAIDITKPNASQTMGDVINSSRDIGVQANIHILNDTDAHGIDALLATQTDYETHKANETDAHGIDVINSRAVNAQAEITSARGSKTDLDSRLSVSLQHDGLIKLTSLASRWIDNSDTPTFVSSLSFTVPGDRTKVYIAGEICRVTVGTGYVYGIVVSASYAAPNTTVSFVSDYPVLTNPISKVEIALLSFDNTIEASVASLAIDVLSLQSQMAGLSYLGLGSYGTVSYENQAVFYENNIVNC
jgi:hypothetical protein